MRLDELVAAIRGEELDVTSLLLAPILRQSRDASADFDALADHVVQSALLIHLKTSRLLPPPPCPLPEPKEADSPPPARLNSLQLQGATLFLKERLGEASPEQSLMEQEPDPAPSEYLNVLDVLRLAKQALEAARAHQDLKLDGASHKIEDMIRILEAALERVGSEAVDLDQLLAAQADPLERISLFLAVLELAKATRIRIQQDTTFSSIALYRYTE